MRELFLILKRFSQVFLFILFESAALVILFQKNDYHRPLAVNALQRMSFRYYSRVNRLREYFALRETNCQLAEENASLRSMLRSAFREPGRGFIPMADSGSLRQYEYMHARVVSNSVTSQYNYLTLDKGSDDGVAPDMAVATDRGVVGIVVSVSPHFSLVISLLNRDLKVSGRLKGSREPGTVEWPGRSYKKVVLKDIPHDTRIMPGDTVVTSGLSSIFPEKLWIGFVEKYRIEGGSFYSVDVLLANDFRKLQWVYIIRNRLRNEQLQLESSFGR